MEDHVRKTALQQLMKIHQSTNVLIVIAYASSAHRLHPIVHSVTQRPPILI